MGFEMFTALAITATADTGYNDVLNSIQSSMGLSGDMTIPTVIFFVIAVFAGLLAGLKAAKKK